jgi:hypothetical protein
VFGFSETDKCWANIVINCEKCPDWSPEFSDIGENGG